MGKEVKWIILIQLKYYKHPKKEEFSFGGGNNVGSTLLKRTHET